MYRIEGKSHYGESICGRTVSPCVQLTHHHMLPLARTGELMGDLFGLPMSDATVLAIQAEAQVLLAPTVAAMGEALKAAPVAHADETGLRVAGKIHWMHVLADITHAITCINEFFVADFQWDPRHLAHGR
ncbi:IS66 family transposase [Thiocystis violacea]|uniref:IS66 family transposase n=1 Tax=Thiocystis violacea TaxID=13725 RepID=UPI00237A4407|nr:transposase [Thiocystis violacea]MBK1725393.1 hypothetical protein [Thiocystis violacea]